MLSRDIVVIGGSAGAIEPLKKIVHGLPKDFSASIFVVIHVSPDSPRMLASLLSRAGPLPASNPKDKEQIRSGHIYVARPDHHLTIEDGKMRVLRGPRENRHRPAIDPLFRTAARAYGRRVLAVLLSGRQDDGSAGIYAVKQRGGLTVVQDPEEAEWKDLPSHAIEYAQPHYVLTVGEIASELMRFTHEPEKEVAMARKSHAAQKPNGRNSRKKPSSPSVLSKPDENQEVAYFDEGEGTPSVFACPECHGVLWELKDDKMVRFRCRVGHTYGTDSLNEELSAASESALWAAVRALEEKAALSRRVSETMANDRKLSQRLVDQSTADTANAHMIRDMIFRQEPALDWQEANSIKKVGVRKRKVA